MNMLCVGGPLDGRRLDIPQTASAVAFPTSRPDAPELGHEMYFPTKWVMANGATVHNFTGVSSRGYCWEWRLRHSSIELPADDEDDDERAG